MTKIRRLIPVLLLLVYTVTAHADSGLNDGYLWKAGVARVVITPEYPVWMAGYSSRTSPSDGKLHDLWAKALVLEDASGNRSLLVTMDLLSIPKDFSDEMRGWVKERYGLDNARIILSTSHTHSGPVISRALKDIYPMSDGDWEAVDRYTEELKEMLHGLIDQAMQRLQPAYLSTGNGILRFQVNRRNNRENSITPLTELKGPNDYSVPVMKIERADNSLLAIRLAMPATPPHWRSISSLEITRGSHKSSLRSSTRVQRPCFFKGEGLTKTPFPGDPYLWPNSTVKSWRRPLKGFFRRIWSGKRAC